MRKYQFQWFLSYTPDFYFIKIYIAERAGTVTESVNVPPEIKSSPLPEMTNDFEELEL